ncbi:MAG: hypothetical protein JSV24_05325 [Bacteroidales bacterium]|nr:MAG: hypothetical protein JSV24_05325 [Bacteroidales bacterium]
MLRSISTGFILFLVLGVSASKAQQIKSFSDDPAQYMEEVVNFMGTRLNDKDQQILNNFKHFWLSGAFSVDEQSRVIQVSNHLLRRRARPVPHFMDYFAAIYQFKQISHDEESYKAWEEGLVSLITNSKIPLSRINRYLQVAYWLLSENMLYKSSSVQWAATSGDYIFRYDSSGFVSIIFERTDLICYAQRDSGSIKQTAGYLNPLTLVWQGNNGTVTWERAGYSETDIYAQLSDYKIDMTKSQYRADSVLFSNSYYFKEPVLGVLVDKITRISQPQRALYPKFDSYIKRFVIEDIYENVDFEGGLSMQGAKMNGSGSEVENATLKLYRNDTLFMQVGSAFFVFMSDRTSSINTNVTIYMEGDSIYHPRIAFSYNVRNRELSLYRTEDVMMRSPYFNSYHKVDMYFEALEWKIDEPVIKFTMARGTSLGQARFESNNYYMENQFYKIQGMDEIHPLELLKRFGEYYYSDQFPVSELAKWMNKPEYQAIQLCIRLSTDGFVYYNENTGEVTLKNRLYDYLAAFAGRIDYDVIDFVSNTNAPLENAFLDLRTMDLTINGVPQIFLSDSQNVAISPNGNKIILKKNRNFAFDGKVQAGLFTFFGEGFVFDYDTFKINLNNIDSLNIAIQSDEFDMYGNHYTIGIENIIQNITGDLMIDKPQNKSGLESFPEYPIFNSKENSFVYYENASNLDSVYAKEDFYFELEPYTIYGLDNFTKEDVSFKGKFESGNVFPTITQTLTVQEDNSLGFEVVVPEEGIPVYGGKGMFYNDVRMSNKGLEGKGELVYLGSTTQSENFFFYPDSMYATATGFQIAESEADRKFPMVKAQNVRVRWYPERDEWYSYKGNTNITMFNEETALDGYLRMSPDGLTGSGIMVMPDANITASDFRYTKSSFESDTADFYLKSLRTDGYAFIAENVTSSIDFTAAKGSFSSNSDTSLVKFPENQFVSTLDYFNWNMEVEELAMGKKDRTVRKPLDETDSLSLLDARLEQPTFVSIDPRQDSLGFVSDSAIYNLRENLITAYNVNFIEVADALIFPYEGKVEIANRAQFRTLEDARIIANQKHSIHSASVRIMNKEEYEASGKYNYTDEDQNVQLIEFNNILVNDDGHTVASGDIIESENFTLNPAFEFIGTVNLDAQKEFLTFTGGARTVHNCQNLERRYLKFISEIDPQNVMIPVATEPRDINNNRIYNGHFISNDSTHIYTAFLSRRKIYSDNPITTAEGFLFFDKGSGKYKIGSREKLADETSTGNFLTFDKNYCQFYGEGQLNLAVEFGQFSVTTVGNILQDLEANKSTLEMLIGLDFYFRPEAITMMANEIGGHPTLEPADLSQSTYRKSIEELIGRERAQTLREEANLYGRISELPAELRFTILLTHVNLVWNDLTSSYRSVGKIGIGNIMNNQLNVMVDGYIEIQKKRSGDLFDVYLKMDDNTWYYFGYSRGVMQSLSSNRDYNASLTELNENQRRLKVNSGETSYIYMVAVNRKLTSFLRRFSENIADEGNDGDER